MQGMRREREKISKVQVWKRRKVFFFYICKHFSFHVYLYTTTICTFFSPSSSEMFALQSSFVKAAAAAASERVLLLLLSAIAFFCSLFFFFCLFGQALEFASSFLPSFPRELTHPPQRAAEKEMGREKSRALVPKKSCFVLMQNCPMLKKRTNFVFYFLQIVHALSSVTPIPSHLPTLSTSHTCSSYLPFSPSSSFGRV